MARRALPLSSFCSFSNLIQSDPTIEYVFDEGVPAMLSVVVGGKYLECDPSHHIILIRNINYKCQNKNKHMYSVELVFLHSIRH